MLHYIIMLYSGIVRQCEINVHVVVVYMCCK